MEWRIGYELEIARGVVIITDINEYACAYNEVADCVVYHKKSKGRISVTNESEYIAHARNVNLFNMYHKNIKKGDNKMIELIKDKIKETNLL